MAQMFAVIFLLSQLQISFSQSLDTKNGDDKCVLGASDKSLLSLNSQLQDVEQKDCLKGWVKHGNSCYMLNTQKLTWEQANDNCRGLSARLVEIETKPENIFIENIIKKREANGQAWLGASDNTQENTWIWNYSGLPLRFSNWRQGEPNNDEGSEDCMGILSQDGTWNDLPCSALFMFVCEKDL
ncbi:perlucin-like [Saccostrea cucullata]|uniref:perlucin-like n=1 Tax=Saccostrea cuccullata TaxID=36930 RepID=UPI002ED18C4E